jgi:hypothetical protein
MVFAAARQQDGENNGSDVARRLTGADKIAGPTRAPTRTLGHPVGTPNLELAQREWIGRRQG